MFFILSPPVSRPTVVKLRSYIFIILFIKNVSVLTFKVNSLFIGIHIYDSIFVFNFKYSYVEFYPRIIFILAIYDVITGRMSGVCL